MAKKKTYFSGEIPVNDCRNVWRGLKSIRLILKKITYLKSSLQRIIQKRILNIYVSYVSLFSELIKHDLVTYISSTCSSKIIVNIGACPFGNKSKIENIGVSAFWEQNYSVLKENHNIQWSYIIRFLQPAGSLLTVIVSKSGNLVIQVQHGFSFKKKMMQHRAQILTTKFYLHLSFRWAEQKYWNFGLKTIVKWIIKKRRPILFAPTLAQEIKK